MDRLPTVGVAKTKRGRYVGGEGVEVEKVRGLLEDVLSGNRRF